MAERELLLGIVAALPAEARAAGARAAPPGEMVDLAGGALLVRSGVGRRRAGRAARMLLDAGARALLSWGVAAALDPALRAGDLVLPEEVLAGDGRRHAVAPAWRARVAAGASARGGTLAEATEVLRSADDKLLLRTLCGADIADMESGVVAEVAALARVPLLVVRSVSDSARARLPDCALAALDADGDLHAGRCLAGLLLSPGDLPALARVAAGFRAACRSLAGVVARGGVAVLAPPERDQA